MTQIVALDSAALSMPSVPGLDDIPEGRRHSMDGFPVLGSDGSVGGSISAAGGIEGIVRSPASDVPELRQLRAPTGPLSTDGFPERQLS